MSIRIKLACMSVVLTLALISSFPSAIAHDHSLQSLAPPPPGIDVESTNGNGDIVVISKITKNDNPAKKVQLSDASKNPVSQPSLVSGVVGFKFSTDKGMIASSDVAEQSWSDKGGVQRTTITRSRIHQIPNAPVANTWSGTAIVWYKFPIGEQTRFAPIIGNFPHHQNVTNHALDIESSSHSNQVMTVKVRGSVKKSKTHVFLDRLQAENLELSNFRSMVVVTGVVEKTGEPFANVYNLTKHEAQELSNGKTFTARVDLSNDNKGPFSINVLVWGGTKNKLGKLSEMALAHSFKAH